MAAVNGDKSATIYYATPNSERRLDPKIVTLTREEEANIRNTITEYRAVLAEEARLKAKKVEIHTSMAATKEKEAKAAQDVLIARQNLAISEQELEASMQELAISKAKEAQKEQAVQRREAEIAKLQAKDVAADQKLKVLEARKANNDTRIQQIDADRENIAAQRADNERKRQEGIAKCEAPKLLIAQRHEAKRAAAALAAAGQSSPSTIRSIA